jgi:hypothetical protein
MTKKKHHPDYEPDIECGSLYLQKEVAVQMMMAISHSLNTDRTLSSLDKKRLGVAATVINDVFDLGEEEDSDG